MGVLWDTFRKHYGPDGAPSVLVARGSTSDFNETIPESEIERELERDRARNTAELLAEFRGDLESYVSRSSARGCVGGYHELPPATATSYYAFTDPSGGSEDSFHPVRLRTAMVSASLSTASARCGRRFRPSW